MKKPLLLTAIVFCSAASMAQEVGRVISSTPVVQQVGVPRQACSTEQIEVQRANSGAGAAIGALTGAALGSASGHGAERAAATMIGAIGGALVGNSVEGQPPTQLRNVQRCSTQTFLESRTVGYHVVYEYAGKQYAVQLPQDPGPTLPLQISPVGAMAQMPPPPPGYSAQQSAYAPPEAVVAQPPNYPVYVERPYYYPPVSVELGVGYWGGYRGHRYWR
jgi:uncharacterized protein YcfJ